MFTEHYLSFKEILEKLSSLDNYMFLALAAIIISIVLVIILWYYILPILEVTWRIKSDKREARSKKALLNKIIIQKDIEEEVEEEIKKLNLKN